MEYKTRTGEIVRANDGQDRLLAAVYGSKWGRLAMKPLVRPGVSRLVKRIMNSRLSARLVPGFCRSNGIVLEEYEKQQFDSYNDFFIRRIRPQLRPINDDRSRLISPCDAKLRVYPISADARVQIKQTTYTLTSLLEDRRLAERFEGGLLCIFRLTVDDYHHYCYVEDGFVSRARRIAGVLHTVNPVAEERVPIYKTNARAYQLLRSERLGTVLMMEVGALSIGEICNLHEAESVSRGQEKGYFAFGGSTVILAFQKDRVSIDTDIIENQAEGYETIVRMGEGIGNIGRL
ncbi:MAG: phosphatidylserine decarboxylase [Eubacteriales bacterium]|nr:phosphatidylserine decarboxylase [Eubacteriales bacterium]